MAISAYIFIECALGKARDVAREIIKISGVKQAHAVTGSYDVIAFVEAPDINELGDVIISRVHSLPGVFRTTTNVVVD